MTNSSNSFSTEGEEEIYLQGDSSGTSSQSSFDKGLSQAWLNLRRESSTTGFSIGLYIKDLEVSWGGTKENSSRQGVKSIIGRSNEGIENKKSE